MNILVIGSGGREHAIARALSRSKSIDQLYCTPGNPGILAVAKKADCNANKFDEVEQFCKKNAINLVVVGPEQPLADGIADHLRSYGIAVFGPSKYSAQLESSKGFAKEFMERYNIPTAGFKRFTSEEAIQAHAYIDSQSIPVVIKADGLAAGKGVVVAETYQIAHEALDSMFSGIFEKAGETVVIEQFLKGEEASLFVISDGEDYILLAPSQDHKRVGEGDTGKNTGGMGAYSPAKVVTRDVLMVVEESIVKPALKGMSAEGSPFIGCLYVGLMIDNGKVNVVEFNVRFGDPETQAVLSIFDGDFAQLLYSASIGKIDKTSIVNTSKGFACCITLASGGYPDSFEKGFEINGVEKAEGNDCIVYHAGTNAIENRIVTNGGRVLGVTGLGDDLKSAIENAYLGVDKIKFEKMYYRRDIGHKGLK